MMIYRVRQVPDPQCSKIVGGNPKLFNWPKLTQLLNMKGREAAIAEIAATAEDGRECENFESQAAVATIARIAA